MKPTNTAIIFTGRTRPATGVYLSIGCLLWASVCVLMLFSASVGGWAGDTGSQDASAAVANVGRTVITELDIAYRVGTEAAYGLAESEGESALVSLINDRLELETARLHGVVVFQREIDSFSDFVDQTSKAPEILRKVKAVFGDNRIAYESSYLKPKLLNRKLRAWYSRNPKFHHRERHLIEKAYYLVRSGKSMEVAAAAHNLSYSNTELNKTGKTVSPLLRAYIPESRKSAPDRLMAILENLSEGEIYRDIVEDDYGYRVIRLKEKAANGYSIETMSVTKRPFGEWFVEQATGIHIAIVDSKLKRKLLAKHPNIWWVVNLKNE